MQKSKQKIPRNILIKKEPEKTIGKALVSAAKEKKRERKERKAEEKKYIKKTNLLFSKVNSSGQLTKNSMGHNL